MEKFKKEIIPLDFFLINDKLYKNLTFKILDGPRRALQKNLIKNDFLHIVFENESNGDLIFQVIRLFDNEILAKKFYDDQNSFKMQIEDNYGNTSPPYLEIKIDMSSFAGISNDEIKYAKIDKNAKIHREMYLENDLPIPNQLIAVFLKKNFVHKIFVSTHTNNDESLLLTSIEKVLSL